LLGSLWPTIVSNYPNLRAAFNGGLYGRQNEPPHFCEALHVDDRWLEDFIEHLSGEDSPYLFSSIPIEILGSVYERFLGSVIDEKGTVQLKPEVRHAGGVYYTPQHIVDAIVNSTLVIHLTEVHGNSIASVKIIDPACGSGSFLIRAFDKLCQRILEEYTADRQRWQRHVFRDANGDIQLTSEYKRRLVVNCIFGVDIDSQAIQVAEMSLYLKILENETTDTLKAQRILFPDETFLPDLRGNLKVGNSLVDTDALDILSSRSDVHTLHAFSWSRAFSVFKAQQGFDIVIGNPPYDVVEKDRKESSWPHDLFREYLDGTERLDAAKGGKLNLYRFFLIQALALARPGGYIGMIVPMSVLGDVTCKSTRLNFLDACANVHIAAFPQKDDRNNRVFYDAKLSTCVLTSSKLDESIWR
jgi:type I restriction-modification system DNA methylase subunit